MTKTEVLNYLCYYDMRNPYFTDLMLDEEDIINKLNCSCDNCFYGRTKLAEFILENFYHD